MADNSPVRCDSCEELWPKNLGPVLKANRGCPACAPEEYD